MEDRISRQKINERDDLTWDERSRIGKKSDDRCCHCGRKCYTNFGATVDHFIPISEGGTNRDINLVMLCDDCNYEKRSKIMEPRGYLKYLRQDHLDKLEGYFESYVQSFEYVKRTNILACDEYTIQVDPPSLGFRKKGGRINGIKRASVEYVMKKAYCDDLPRLHDFFLRVLKKYDGLDNEREAMLNLQFWMRFGCIYYIEKNKEIKTMLVVTLQDQDGDEKAAECGVNKAFMLLVFNYYSNETAWSLAEEIMKRIPDCLFQERGLTQLPIKYVFLKNDPLANKIMYVWGYNLVETGVFLINYSILYKGDKMKGKKPSENMDLQTFFGKFRDVEKEMKQWIIQNDAYSVSWMCNNIILKEGDTGLDTSDDEDAPENNKKAV